MILNHTTKNPSTSEMLTQDSSSDSIYAVLKGVVCSLDYASAIFSDTWSLLVCNEKFNHFFESGSGQNSITEPTLLCSLVSSIQKTSIDGGYFKLKLQTTNGTIPFLIKVSNFPMSDGQTSGYILSLQQIQDTLLEDSKMTDFSILSSLKQMEEFAQKAESANKAKSEFLSNMSHEIRTPLNGVLGAINLLLASDLNTQQRCYAEISKKSGESLLRLLNDILDFSKIESGRLELEEVSFSIFEVLEDVAEIVYHRLTQKNIKFVYDLKPGCPEFVRGDIGRLRQILVNLAGNAVKFTSEGSIRLTASLESETAEEYLLRFEVSDTGIGIPSGKLHKLFSPFSQVDASTTRQFGGTGLGLSICKHLSQLMGGDIGVISTAGEGSTFWFTIKFAKTSECFENPYLDGSVLLFAPKDSLIISEPVLQSLGLKVLLASDSESVPSILNENINIIAIIADYDIGLEQLGNLGKIIQSRNPHPKMLMILPAHKFQVEEDFIKQNGYTELLARPVKRSKFFKALNIQPCDIVKKDIFDHSPETKLERGKYKILLVEDNQINQMIAINLLQEMEYNADAVANGQEAVEALTRINYDLVLMDCQMPVMDGYEATALIRSGESAVLNMNIPIIAMTANAMKGDKEKCLTVGMNDYITKPIIFDILQLSLEKWLEFGREGAVRVQPKTRLKPSWERFTKPRRV